MNVLSNHTQALDMPDGEKGLDAEDYAFVHPNRSSLTINLWVCHTMLPFLYLGMLDRWGQFAGDRLLLPALVYFASCVFMIAHRLPSFG